MKKRVKVSDNKKALDSIMCVYSTSENAVEALTLITNIVSTTHIVRISRMSPLDGPVELASLLRDPIREVYWLEEAT